MPSVTEAVQLGRVHTNGFHLYGIGIWNNKKFSGPVGRQSKNYKLIKKSADFSLDTLYLGDKNGRRVLCIYNKKKQQTKKADGSPCAGLTVETHIELRVNYKKAFVNPSAWSSFFRDYFSLEASLARTSFFLQEISSMVAVVKKQRQKGLGEAAISTLADWWTAAVIDPLQDLRVSFLRGIKELLDTKKYTNRQHPYSSYYYENYITDPTFKAALLYMFLITGK